MIKLLYLLDAVDGIGGTEGQLLELLKRLDRRRFEPHLGVFRATADLEPLAALASSVRVFGVPRLLHPMAALKLIPVTSHVRREAFQIVHVFMNAASIAAPLFCRLGGARVIGSRRDMGFWYTPRQLAVLRISNRFVERIIANSDAVRQHAHRLEGFPLDRMHVFYNGHDAVRFEAGPLAGFRERHNIDDDAPIVGIVANFNAWKRHDDLLRAFSLVRARHPRARLVLVGGGELESPLRDATRALRLEGAVRFVAGVRDAVPVIRHFSIGVLCSESEGFSNAVLEYMHCGKPVVTTNVGGNREIVTEGVTGFLVNPGDVESLADRIARLLDSSSLAESMGRRAAQSVRGLTSARMVESHMDLYETLARGGAGAPVPVPSQAR